MPIARRYLLIALFLAGCRPAAVHESATQSVSLLGNRVQVTLPAPDAEQMSKIVEMLKASDQRFGELWNPRNPQSELTLINQVGRQRAVPVSDPTQELLWVCKYYWERSGGLFDITTSPLTELWGLSPGLRPRPVSDSVAQAVRRYVGGHLLSVDAGLVRIESELAQVNFGSVAPSYVMDRIIKELHLAGIPNLMLDAGHVVRALGRQSPDLPWMWPLENPFVKDEHLGFVILDGAAALATIRLKDRQVEIDGEPYSNSVNPQTGQPARGVAAVFALAPTATEATALSEALFVGGLEAAPGLLQAFPRAEALLVIEEDSPRIWMTEDRQGRFRIAGREAPTLQPPATSPHRPAAPVFSIADIALASGAADAPQEVPPLTPGEVDAIWAGHLAWKGDQSSESLEDREVWLREALRLRPSSHALIKALASVYRESGEEAMYRMSAGHLSGLGILPPSPQPPNALAVDNEHPAAPQQELHSFRGLVGEGRLAEAERALREMLRTAPWDEELLHALGQFFILADEPGMCAMTYQMLLAQYPTNAAYALNCSTCLHAAGQTQPALLLLADFLEANPAQTDLIHNIIVLAGQLGDEAMVTTYAEVWPQRAPTLPRAWMTAAHIHLYRGALQQAREAAERAHALDPDSPAPLRYLAEIAKREKSQATPVDPEEHDLAPAMPLPAAPPRSSDKEPGSQYLLVEASPSGADALAAGRLGRPATLLALWQDRIAATASDDLDAMLFHAWLQARDEPLEGDILLEWADLLARRGDVQTALNAVGAFQERYAATGAEWMGAGERFEQLGAAASALRCYRNAMKTGELLPSEAAELAERLERLERAPAVEALPP